MGLLTRVVGKLFETKPQLSDADVRRGVTLLNIDGLASTGMGTLQGGPFLVAFALALGASNYEIGLLASIGFASQFMQVPGLFLVNSVARRRAITVMTAAASRLLWVFIILIPFIFVKRGATFLLQWMLVAALVGALPGPAWNSWIRDLVPAEAMGRVFAKRMILATILAIALTVGGGHFVDWWEIAYPAHNLYSYSILFGIGLVFGLSGVLAIYGMPEPTMKVEKNVSVLGLLGKPMQDANFRRLLSFIAMWNFAVNLAGPFFIVYLVKRLEVSLLMVTVLTVVSQVTNLLFLRIWGRLADRFSNKAVLALSGPLFLFAVLAWTFTTMPEKHALTVPILFGIYVLSGMSLAGVSLASANIAFKLSPKGLAHAYMTAYGLAGAVTGAVAPLAGGVFADIFAERGLAISLNWSEPARELSIYALNVKALDFLFVIAFVLGLFSIRRLARVHEEGVIDDQALKQEFMSEVSMPFRMVASIPGVRHLIALPVSAIHRLTGISRDSEGAESSEAPPAEDQSAAEQEGSASAGDEGGRS